MDDHRLGRMAWVLRQRLELRQEDVAARAGVSPDTVSRLERGDIGGMTLATIRRIFAVFDAEVVLYVRWRGGDIDRLMDRRHAEMGEALVERLSGLGWALMPEVSFSEFGERGSIDLLGWHPATCTLLVIELKTELTSIEETIRRHDAKARLGAKIARKRLGWEAEAVARLLVLPEERTPRRQVERHEGLFHRSYPMRGWELRRWLASPSAGPAGDAPAPASPRSGSSPGAAPAPAVAASSSRAAPGGAAGLSGPSGLLFLPNADDMRAKRKLGPRKRIRVASMALKHHESGLDRSKVSPTADPVGD
jgi:HTH-type transcriptional regulator / antitoxin HipB